MVVFRSDCLSMVYSFYNDKIMFQVKGKGLIMCLKHIYANPVVVEMHPSWLDTKGKRFYVQKKRQLIQL